MGHGNDKQLTDHLTEAEQLAVEVHKYYLSEAAGYDVGVDYAIQHWLEHHATDWRHDQLEDELAAQRREIEKHKWIESERAGRDLGDAAILDWIVRFAARWRQLHAHR